MAWTTPRTWTTGEVVTKAIMDTHVKGNFDVTAPAVLTAQGDILYASAANAPARLAKDANSTRVLTNTGSSNNPAWAQVALATGVSGTLPVANGGTGATSLTDKAVLISQDSGTDTLGSVALTTSGQVIIGGASGPAAGTLTAGDGIDITNGDGSIEIISETASTTNAGMSELATTAETSTGSDTGRTVTPDGLAGSVHGERVIQMVVVDFATALTTGNGKFYFHVPLTLNGFNIISVHAEVISAPSGSTIIIQLRNVTQSADILSTLLTIDASETGSDTAAAAAVISGTEDDLTTNDVIAVDIDQVGSSTAGSGLIVTLVCRLP